MQPFILNTVPEADFDTPLTEVEGILNSATDLKMFCQERQYLNLSTVGIPPIEEPNSETPSWGLSPKAY
jgi:hypothetical protein